MDDTAEKDFNDMPRDDRAPAVRMHMEAGGSIRSAAREFSSTPGAIAGIMRDYGIPSKNRSGFAKAEKSSSGIVLKFAHHESVACKAVDGQGRQCGYLPAPGSEYCGLPQHQALAKRKLARQ